MVDDTYDFVKVKRRNGGKSSDLITLAASIRSLAAFLVELFHITEQRTSDNHGAHTTVFNAEEIEGVIVGARRALATIDALVNVSDLGFLAFFVVASIVERELYIVNAAHRARRAANSAIAHVDSKGDSMSFVLIVDIELLT